MSHELERRLERLFRDPRASIDVEERARGLALAALPAPTRRQPTAHAPDRRGCDCLCARGHRRRLGHGRRSPRESRCRGTATTARTRSGGRAAARSSHWIVRGGGCRRRTAVADHAGRAAVLGLPVDAATLSPHALYVAAGIGSSLIAMAPNDPGLVAPGSRSRRRNRVGPRRSSNCLRCLLADD